MERKKKKFVLAFRSKINNYKLEQGDKNKMGFMDKIDVNKLGAVADEVNKAVDVEKVAKAAVHGGKVPSYT